MTDIISADITPETETTDTSFQQDAGSDGADDIVTNDVDTDFTDQTDDVLNSIPQYDPGADDSAYNDTDFTGMQELQPQTTQILPDGRFMISYDEDLNGIIEKQEIIGDDSYTVSFDSTQRGAFDTEKTVITDPDSGDIKMIIETSDYDGDGNADYMNAFIDTDGTDGFDMSVKGYDIDSEPGIDRFEADFDLDTDHNTDLRIITEYIDEDSDHAYDTYKVTIDDGTQSVTGVYTFEETALSPVPVPEFDFSEPRELPQFDSGSADPESVVGDPETSMEHWEYQGMTDRCALFAQKSTIEECLGLPSIDIEEFADTAEENGWFSENGGTMPLNINKMLDHYGVENEMTFHNSFEHLRECLENGYKVIVSVDADEIWYDESDDIFTPGDGANHALRVIGIDESDPSAPKVILNDSGTTNGCGELVPVDTFIDAWEDGNCQMVVCRPAA